MNEPILSAHGLKKTYAIGSRTLEVLRGVDVEISRGDFVALRGASGTGKSTLLHLIGGLDTPNAGEIIFRGQKLSEFSESKLTHFRNRSVGFVFQAYHLLPELTALENVCLSARIARISAADAAEKRGRELLVARRPRRTRWSTSHPNFPAANSSASPSPARSSTNRNCCWPTSRREIWIRKTGGEIIELLKASLRAEKQMTLVIATHDEKVAKHAQRVIELVDGRIAS
jgi:lipoprotein-releasing system ATP-binding protein